MTRSPGRAVNVPGRGLVSEQPSDLTVSRLQRDLTYRCYMCPDGRRVDGAPVESFCTHDPAVMLMHAVDHLIGGLAVPVSGLRLLARDALR